MFCPEKNSYLQLVCAMAPRVINKAVDRAMSKKNVAPPGDSAKQVAGLCKCWHEKEEPKDPLAAIGLVSAQPSTYAPQVDVTRAPLGFGRIGLRVVVRDLNSEDHLTQLQALHTILDQVQISENAMFLINLNVVHRLKDLLDNRDPVIREKVCMALTHLAGYYQGRRHLGPCPGLVFRLIWIIMRDKPQIRYAAAKMLRTLSRDRCSCADICKVDIVIENLLKTVQNEYTGIVLLHLKTMNNLFEWDPVVPLKANAFQVMLKLFKNRDPDVVCMAMECMAQLCKHDVGKMLADEYDLTVLLKPYIKCTNYDVVFSAVGLMCYTTLTRRSKWRVKEVQTALVRKLTFLLHAPALPVLQLRIMQLFINLCDCPDIKNNIRTFWERKIGLVMIRTHDEWDGTTETTSMGLETGHNYRTMCIEGVETIKNDYGDNAEVVNVHSYLRRLREKKKQLLVAIHATPYT